MAGGGPTAASSLYSGIFNSDADGKNPSASEAGRSNDASPTQAAKEVGAVDVGTNDAKESSASAGATTAKPQAWSAALRFAPRKNISNQANKLRKPAAASILSSTFSSAPVLPDAAELVTPVVAATPARPGQVQSSSTAALEDVPFSAGTHGWAKLKQTGESSKLPLHIDALHTGDADDDAVFSLPIITTPPALSIPEEELERDAALFASLAEKRGETRHGHKGEQEWQDDEEEEEDVNGFTNTEAGRKAKRRRYKKKRNTSPGLHGGPPTSLRMDADYDVRVPNDYNEFKELTRKRRQAAKQRASVRAAQDRERDFDDYDDTHQGDNSAEEEDDDAYKRKRMNRFAPPAIYRSEAPAFTASFEGDDEDEKPYLSPPPPERPASSIATPSAPPIAAETGEEAYLRRLAMSRAVPSSSLEPEQSYTPVATPRIDLAARAAAAASIAAKLAKAAPPQGGEEQSQLSMPVTPSVTPFPSTTQSSADFSSFAQRLMEKQGWKEGEALGAEGNKGLLDPILAKKVEGERMKHQQQHRSSSDRPAISNRGTIVNAHEEEKRREEREKYGTASEVILLEDVVNLADIDDDLSDEIGEECAKHGYVERVFIWPQGPRGVRIFVRFSGMAGAWRCLKDLDGRFFGGKIVRARYYPLHDFERGHYMRVFG